MSFARFWARQGHDVEFMYMPIISTPAQVEEVLKYRLNLIGLELLFTDLANPLIQPDACGLITPKSS